MNADANSLPSSKPNGFLALARLEEEDDDDVDDEPVVEDEDVLNGDPLNPVLNPAENPVFLLLALPVAVEPGE